jgi:ubiquitin-conjugating enzyme E2 J1
MKKIFSAVKRLMREAVEMKNPTELYYCQPIEVNIWIKHSKFFLLLKQDNLFEWHFTIRGPISTEFEQGIYHGRILFPVEYPMKPPSIILLTVCYSKWIFLSIKQFVLI